ncbi:tRNA pseudouridine(13) synthase TruD [Candidatus Woesearchaeota archaeon]|nr:tRNA pseudouridine(13) synthase TruD [Candidatus Woesearchaeota archaeon]
MYILKSTPEDFIVEEQIKLKLDDSGEYAYFWLRKRDTTTPYAIRRIAGWLRCKERDIGFAGNKDRQAVTKQAISVKDPQHRVGAERFAKMDIEGVSLEHIGRGNTPVSLGSLDGNRFEIVLRDCDHPPRAAERMVNYFDDQRFSDTNVDVGRAIVKGDFAAACKLVKSGDVRAYLEEHPTDPIGAIKQMPLKIRMMLVHAYQSWMWNSVVSQYLQCKYGAGGAEKAKSVQYSLGKLSVPVDIGAELADMKIPIPGFGTELGSDEVSAIIKKLLAEEGVGVRDFVIRSMPELSAEGGERAIVVDVSGLTVEKTGDSEYRLKFMLPKGSYATMAVKQMMA